MLKFSDFIKINEAEENRNVDVLASQPTQTRTAIGQSPTSLLQMFDFFIQKYNQRNIASALRNQRSAKTHFLVVLDEAFTWIVRFRNCEASRWIRKPCAFRNLCENRRNQLAFERFGHFGLDIDSKKVWH